MPIKRGFTLFELALVVVLIGIFYSIFVQKLDFFMERREELKIERLREYLLEFKYDEKASILCTKEGTYLDKCNECYVYLDNNKTDVRLELFEKEPTIYVFDKKERELKKKEYKPIRVSSYEEMAVCFRYECKKNRSCTPLIMQNNEDFYIFYPYFKETIKLGSLELVKDEIIKEKESLRKDAF